MGINGLWEYVKSTVERKPLTALALQNGVRADAAYQPFRIGVDISIWFAQSQQSFLLAHAQAGENPELNLIFNRVARLFRSPVLPVFVFDGPARPATKRKKMIVTKEHWLAAPTRELISAFGFIYLDAPGEAEAELASMNANGIIDAVLSDDGDTLVFGATTVIRNPTIKQDGDCVDFYTNHVGTCTAAPRMLTREGFVLVAVLAGGDYDPKGLQSCGADTAARLARYGLGEQLVTAAMLPLNEVPHALAQWRARLCEVLRTDPEGHLGRRQRSIADNVRAEFLDITVVRAYCAPLVTPLAQLRAAVDIEWSMPDVVKLSHICERHFGWGVEPEIVRKFLKLLWPGVLLRHLCRTPTRAKSTLTPLIDPVERFTIIAKTQRDGVPVYRVSMSNSAFTDTITADLFHSRPLTPAYKYKCRKLNADAIEVHGYVVDVPGSLMHSFQSDSMASLDHKALMRPPDETSTVITKRGRRVRTIITPQPVRVRLRNSNCPVPVLYQGAPVASTSGQRGVDVIDLTLTDSDDDISTSTVCIF